MTTKLSRGYVALIEAPSTTERETRTRAVLAQVIGQPAGDAMSILMGAVVSAIANTWPRHMVGPAIDEFCALLQDAKPDALRIADIAAGDRREAGHE